MDLSESMQKRSQFCLVELVSKCNIKCPFCFQSDGTFRTNEYMGEMDIKLAEINRSDRRTKIRGVTFASRGEPLLHSRLGEILKYVGTKEK